MIEIELLGASARALIYVGSVAVAGAVLFAVSFPRAGRRSHRSCSGRRRLGFLLLLVAEPLRYAGFQLAIADGDWALAFGPDMRWMGLQTPVGARRGGAADRGRGDRARSGCACAHWDLRRRSSWSGRSCCRATR